MENEIKKVGESMTNQQADMVLEMVKMLAEDSDSIEEFLKKLDRAQSKLSKKVTADPAKTEQ